MLHFYADDIQLYFSFNSTDSCRLVILKDCLDDIKCWMSCYKDYNIVSLVLLAQAEPSTAEQNWSGYGPDFSFLTSSRSTQYNIFSIILRFGHADKLVRCLCEVAVH